MSPKNGIFVSTSLLDESISPPITMDCPSRTDTVVLAVRFWAEGLPFGGDLENRWRLYPATASVTTLTFHDGADRPVMTYHAPCQP